ncbi:unnamed protein product, partial [Bubo scandiacus]
MQSGRHLGSEEGILGSCSVVRKIMSVPCGAVSGDRSQMQPLLYGRLSFSAENSLPPSQTSSKTFSRYCGSLRLKRGEKGGAEKRLSLSPSLSLPPAGSLGGAGGGHDGVLPHPGGSRPPLSPPAAASTPPSTGSLVQRFPRLPLPEAHTALPGQAPVGCTLPPSVGPAWPGLTRVTSRGL